MIRKLRVKFIIINMSLVCLVLLIVFTAIFISTYQKLQFQSHDNLRKAIDQRDKFKSGMKAEVPKEDGHSPMTFTPTVCVLLDDEGNLLSVIDNKASASDELIAETVKQVQKQTAEEGILRESNLRFLKRDTPEGTKLAFCDRSSENNTLRGLLLTSVFVGAGGLIAFFFISLFLSSLALRPVEQAWKQQRQFVADASHELKTPLTVILANQEILLAHASETIAQHVKWISNTQEEALRMKNLVNDMLFLAKTDADRSVPEMVRFNVSDTILNCLLTFESVAFEKGVSIDSQIEPELYLKGNENQMKQLLMILLDNACKYANRSDYASKSAAENQLPVVTAKLSEARSSIHFSINNPGSPIPQEDIPHIFERFYRSDKSRSQEHRGYGLGLAIAKSIVVIHHGSITVTSDAERGTTFAVTIPILGNH